MIIYYGIVDRKTPECQPSSHSRHE